MTKKIYLAAIAALALGFQAQAQLNVLPSGATRIGTPTATDTTAAIQIAAIDNMNAKISFGEPTANLTSVASIGRMGNKLSLYGKDGVRLTDGNAVALRSNTDAGYQVNVPQPLSTHALYIAADPQLNESGYGNISSALDLISTLTAKSYRLYVPGSVVAIGGDEIEDPEGPILRNGDDPASGEEPEFEFEIGDSLRYGFQVSAVEAVLPNLVTTDEDGYKYIDYSSLVSLLVSAVNELRAEVEALQSAPEQRAPMSQPTLTPTTAINDIAAEVIMPALGQNVPNPFTEDTRINVSLPTDVAVAMVYVYDLQGRQIKSIPISERGHTAVTINGSELPAGMYIYTLITDGREVDTKRMILTK